MFHKQIVSKQIYGQKFSSDFPICLHYLSLSQDTRKYPDLMTKFLILITTLVSKWTCISCIDTRQGIISGNSPKALRKRCFSTRFPDQEIMWNLGTLCSDSYFVKHLRTTYFKFCQLTFTFSHSTIPFVISLTCSADWTINAESFAATKWTSGVCAFLDRETASAISML